MAKIVEDMVAIKLSKIAKDDAPEAPHDPGESHSRQVVAEPPPVLPTTPHVVHR